MSKRTRTKKHSVSVTHEDYIAMNRGPFRLEPGQVQAAAVLHAAMREAHAELRGHRAIDVIMGSLPRQFVANWAREFLAAEEQRLAA